MMNDYRKQRRRQAGLMPPPKKNFVIEIGGSRGVRADEVFEKNSKRQPSSKWLKEGADGVFKKNEVGKWLGCGLSRGLMNFFVNKFFEHPRGKILATPLTENES